MDCYYRLCKNSNKQIELILLHIEIIKQTQKEKTIISTLFETLFYYIDYNKHLEIACKKLQQIKNQIDYR